MIKPIELAWLKREARERYDKDLHDLTDAELHAIEPEGLCMLCAGPLTGTSIDYCLHCDPDPHVRRPRLVVVR